MKKLSILAFTFIILATTSNIALAENNNGRTIDLPCVQSAVATREGTIQKAFTKFSTAVSAALSTRASALNTAWGITDGPQRRAARKAAWETYRTSNQSSRTTFKSEKRSAWETFKTASGTCRVEVVESEMNDNII